MDERRLAPQTNALGLLPEQVLVVETVGSIQNFIRAIDKVPGLEWLGEYEIDDIAPDSDKLLRGQLFLVMTDQQALHQLQSLFKRWQRAPGAAFDRGLAPLKRAFEHIHTIRPWSIEDRIRETGILEDWRERLQHDEGAVPFEAEFWFRSSAERHGQAESHLHSMVDSLEGEVIQQCVIPDVAYHAILGRLPHARVQAIVADPDAFRGIRLLQCEDIMHVRSVGQCAIGVPYDDEAEPLTDDDPAGEVQRPNRSDSAPVVALFDGMPLTGHRRLDNRLRVDDPDGYETAYQAHERVHGTGMASLICHGDLDQRGDAAEEPLYARPILQPRRGYDGQFTEAIPQNVLPVDLVHRAVRRLFEAENGEPPAAPSVRFVNLSVGDPVRPLVREMSAWARLLDWLAWKYGILFIVSAGNHSQDIKLETPRRDLGKLSPDEREQAVIKAVAADTRNRRLLSPAETVNGLTVGALHQDASSPSPPTSANLIDPFVRSGMPNVASAHGPGYRRAIKPDILLPGGRQLLAERLGTTHSKGTLQIREFTSPPGQRVATPGDTGRLDETRYSSGTSNAAAVASRGAGLLYRLIGQLRQQPDTPVPPEYDVVLTKALLAHGAGWTDARPAYEAALRNDRNSRTFREYLGRFLGYGSADLVKVMSCTEQRVTVLGFGELDDGKGANFSFPLPPSLSAVNERRRLTITLAWLSPVNSSRQSYRVAHLWFDPKNKLAPGRRFADHRAAQRGTLQHEVLEGRKAEDFKDGDSIAIKVNCRADAGDMSGPIPYGLAVSLEVMEGVTPRPIPVPIYREVRDRLAVRVPIQGADSP